MNGENLDRTGLAPTDIPVSAPPPRRPRWRKFLVPGLIGLAVVGGLGWTVFNRVILPLMIVSQMKPQPTPVPLANPKTSIIEDTSDYAASLDSRQSITLQPRVSGQISEIYVRSGQQVSAGQAILQIDNREQRAQVASRQSASQTAEAEIDSAQADVENARQTLESLQARKATAESNARLSQKEYDRFVTLQRQGATSQQVVEQRRNALETAQAAVREADADLNAQRSTIARSEATVERNRRAFEQSQANVAEGQAQLQDYTVTAPFAGTVGEIPIKVGDTVSPTSELLNITQNQQLEVQIQVPLERSNALRLGLPVKLLDDQSKEVQTGRVSFVAPNVDPATQSVQVKAVFENVRNLRASQFVRARIVWSKRSGVLVPTSAISRLGGRDFIFVAAPLSASGCSEPAAPQGGGKFEANPDMLVAVQKPIKLGRIIGNEQEVVEGLSANDRMITAGILQLQNCAAIADAAQVPAN
ncbi:MAG: efflux RND transporter periplasmic adaptor subunit [Leptolyngbya sp. Prado105]|nr:efflux RND transporter periplasmic adaptor subunit [Leptolyngbya sp. Prado105]